MDYCESVILSPRLDVRIPKIVCLMFAGIVFSWLRVLVSAMHTQSTHMKAKLVYSVLVSFHPPCLLAACSSEYDGFILGLGSHFYSLYHVFSRPRLWVVPSKYPWRVFPWHLFWAGNTPSILCACKWRRWQASRAGVVYGRLVCVCPVSGFGV